MLVWSSSTVAKLSNGIWTLSALSGAIGVEPLEEKNPVLCIPNEWNPLLPEPRYEDCNI